MKKSLGSMPNFKVLRWYGQTILFVASILVIWHLPAYAETGKETASSRGAKLKLTGTININTASLPELVQLPGIGINRAMMIIRYREKHIFTRKSELMRIKGIGRKLYNKLEAHISLADPPKLVIMNQPMDASHGNSPDTAPHPEAPKKL